MQTVDHEQIKSEPEIEVENPSGKNCEHEDISSDDFTGQIPIKVHNWFRLCNVNESTA